tara:strand:- start:16 stop:558 length:543 start_codon:yes stop_codon:yes gene_type:complete
MANKLIYDLIKAIGDNPDREGLLDTPKRVIKSWETIFGGYKLTPEEVLTTQFSETYDEMVICKDIEFYSTCEHHLLPFYGKCHIGYLPNGKIVGLSKMPRLVEVFARRLQVQERLTEQIANSMMEILEPRGVGVIMEAKHHCVVCRGVQKQNSVMITSALKGLFSEFNVKSEFHTLCFPK